MANTINWTNVTTLNDWLQTPNTATEGYFWVLILYSVIAILTISMIQFGFEIALIASLFIGMIIGIILLYMGLISIGWLGMIIGALLFAIIYLLSTSNKGQGY